MSDELEITKKVSEVFEEMLPPIDYHESCKCKFCAAYTKLRALIDKLKKQEVDDDPAGHY